MPAKYFNVGVVFPRPADLSSVSVKLSADGWKITYPEMINPPAGMYHFGVWPEFDVLNGKPGWLDVTIEGARDKEGKAFSSKPISFRVIAVGPSDAQAPPAGTLVCPGLEVAPPGGNH